MIIGCDSSWYVTRMCNIPKSGITWCNNKDQVHPCSSMPLSRPTDNAALWPVDMQYLPGSTCCTMPREIASYSGLPHAALCTSAGSLTVLHFGLLTCSMCLEAFAAYGPGTQQATQVNGASYCEFRLLKLAAMQQHQARLTVPVSLAK